MFLSHLNAFLGFIAFVLFLVRFKRLSFAENLLFLFVTLNFASSALWLFVNYYNNNINPFIDFFGVYVENILLTIGILYFYFFGKTKSTKYQLITLTILVVFSSLLYVIHFYISDQNNFIFHPSNQNVKYNLNFQIILDVIFFLTFLWNYFKNLSVSNELFDGNFKKYILTAIIFYYLQDIGVLILFRLAIDGITVSSILMNTTLFLNFIICLSLVLIAIYTNWLKEYNQLRGKNETKFNLYEKYITIQDLEKLPKIDWIELVKNFNNTHPNLISQIENNSELTANEKIYAFLDYFNLSNKELSSLLFVTVRTIETNFYRMRKKINTQN